MSKKEPRKYCRILFILKENKHCTIIKTLLRIYIHVEQGTRNEHGVTRQLTHSTIPSSVSRPDILTLFTLILKEKTQSQMRGDDSDSIKLIKND